MTDRPTDLATQSVTIGRIYVRRNAMRPKNINTRIQGQNSGSHPASNIVTRSENYQDYSCHIGQNELHGLTITKPLFNFVIVFVE